MDGESTGLNDDLDDDGACPLAGRALRFVLVAELMKRPDMTVAEMTAVVHRHGHQISGRASKVVSDGPDDHWVQLRATAVETSAPLSHNTAPTGGARDRPPDSRVGVPGAHPIRRDIGWAQ